MMPTSWTTGATLFGPWPSPSHLMPAIAFRREVGFVRLCLVTSHQGIYKATTQRAISWPLLVIKLIEKGGYVWSLGMADKYMWQRAYFLIGSSHEGERVLNVCLCVTTFPCVYVYVSGSVCRIIL